MWPNRVLCSALEEMRKQLTLVDIHSLERYKSLQAMMIEEIQTMANRMEAGLEDKGDLIKLTDQRSALRKEVKELKRKVKKLKLALDEKVAPDREERIGSRVSQLLEDLDD
jgi:predicted  nucleic acid-binding Zn-ribbon protein